MEGGLKVLCDGLSALALIGAICKLSMCLVSRRGYFLAVNLMM